MTDWDGKGYEQISGLQRHLAQVTLEGLEFRGDEALLDVGCGDGFITRSIAARLPHGSVLGIDASPRMIAAATDAPDGPGAPVRFEVLDVRTLQAVNEFDAAVSFNALHWLVDQGAALGPIARAVRPGGRVLIQMVCAGPRPSLERLAMQVSARPRWQANFDGFAAPFLHVQPDDYPGIAESAGLRVTSQTVQDVEWDFGSREAFTQWCTVGFTDWTARLAPSEAGVWVDEVVADYEQLVGRQGLFRFLQLRAELTPTA